MDLPMTRTNPAPRLALVLALAAAPFAAFAQEAEAPATEAPATEAPAAGTTAAPASDLSLGAEVQAADGPGTTYTAETFGSWEQRCIRAEDGSDPCQLYQLLKDEAGNSVAEISLFGLPAGQPAAAGATIIAPLETLLTEQLTISVDGATPKRYPFTWCAPIGCIARVGFTAAEIEQFKAGAKATMSIVPVAAPDQRVNLDISLSGFTAGFEAVAAVSTPAP
jgi:invasion protein IalB